MATNLSAKNPLWPGPRLLVPITLDILLIGKRTGAWADLSLKYSDLFKGGDATQGPFATKDPPESGAHLLWTLPYALRSGQQQDSGEVVFPLVPNRWIILRSYTAKLGQPPTLTAGVLQSDFLQPIQSQLSQYPDPSHPSSVQNIGKYFAISQWTAPPGPQNPFLQAVGPGDVSWAVAYDNVRNVFGFYDALPDSQQGYYTYQVIGYYATAQDDPLFGKSKQNPNGWTTQEQWQALMDQFRWSVGNAQDLQKAQQDWYQWQSARGLSGGAINPEQLNFPAQILCHGMVFNIQWQGTGYSYPSGVPGGGNQYPIVAIGNTGIEAISAWMAKSLDLEVERLLEAFQQDLIFEFESDTVEFESLLHQARFGSAYSGQEWRVIRPEDSENAGDSSGGDQTVPLSEAETELLTNLNRSQADLDDLSRQLSSQNQELFAATWKRSKMSRKDQQKYPQIWQKINDTIVALKQSIPQTQQDIQNKKADVERQLSQLQTAVSPQFVVKTTDLPRYWAPAEPVIMVAGAKSDTKLAEPGTYSEEETLFTRFTGQTIASLTISFNINGQTNTQIVTAEDLFRGVNWPQGAPAFNEIPSLIPKEITELWIEALFFDPNLAQFLAQIFFNKAGVTPTPQQLASLTQQIKNQQTAIWNNPEDTGVDAIALTQISGYQGTIPAKSSVETWLPPWTPIYMDWSVEWHPTSSTPNNALQNWQLGEIDYEWEGTAVTNTFTSFQGRTILNSKVALGLSEKLQTFLTSNPSLDRLPEYQIEELNSVVQKLGQFDVLTQAMSGFNQLLLMQQVTMTNLLNDPELAALVSSSEIYVPQPGTIANPAAYYPIRSGHLKIAELRIVDSFGQILRGSPINTPVMPIRAESVVTAGQNNQSFIQLTPRYSQAANLDFRLLDADRDDVFSSSSDLTSPICGWMLPNHLDSSLIVFNALGENQGSVIMIEKDMGTGLRWDAVPGLDIPLGSPPNLPNQHLQAFVMGLLQRGLEGSDALVELLNAIDSTLWQSDPLGNDQSNFSILLGHPLALVRTRIRLTLYGDPAYNQSYSKTGDRATDGFTDVAFPVRVGDTGVKRNGVMGYFLDDDYLHFYPAYGYSPQVAQLRQALSLPPAQAKAALSEIIRSGETMLTVSQSTPTDPYLHLNNLIQLPADNKTQKYLTLIVDPRGLIPAISGIQPIEYLALASGQITSALENMAATFRMGPILTDPDKIRMPLPGEIQGHWSWVARPNVTVWQEDDRIEPENPVARLAENPLRLSEGWLKLSGALKKPQ